MLSKRHLLKRLVATCIEGTPYSTFKPMFEVTAPSTTKWRWGTICKTLPKVLSLYRPLKLVWSAVKFLAGEEQVLVEEDAVDQGRLAGRDDAHDEDMATLRTQDITKALQNPFWLAYAHMILAVHDVGNRISSWGFWLCMPRMAAAKGQCRAWDSK